MKISNLILIFLIFGTLCMASMAQTPDNLVSLGPKCDVIKSAENVSVSSNVSSGNAQLTYILSWVNSTSVLDMILTTPSGKKIDSSAQPPIVYRKNETTITYIVPDPETGKWNAEITAKTAPELGEDYCAFTFLTLGGKQFNETINETSNLTRTQVLAKCPTCNQSG
jgi:hypothetical protein